MNKLLKKEIQKTSLFIIGGGLLVLLGYFQTGTNQKTLYAMGIAFAMIGLGTIMIYLFLGNKPEYMANLRAEKEERSVYIRRKTGNLCFWLTFPAIVITSNIDYFGKMDVSDYAILVLLYMSVIYFGTIGYFLKKH